MSYTALYRKWRPDHFDDLVGQDHIVKTLTNQINANRTSHAYLFCGTRGTGKTSTAKIFARAVNCETPINGSPCNKCNTCTTMLHHQNMNVIEIDAASNNGVDNIREIREEVKYSPAEGKYKVYIIDEVHMLSSGAFNALLKTLEEPPAHVKFILATTEPHKIPATILSRCQRYDFKRISTETIAKQLMYYLEEEDIEAEEKAVYYIAKAADGSMRDGLSILDQCIAFYLGEKITFEKVLEVLGAVDSDVFHKLTSKFLAKNIKGVMEIIDEVVMQGRDLSNFLLDEVSYLRNLLLVKTMEDASEVIDVSADVYKLIQEQSETIDESMIIHYIKEISNLEASIKFVPSKRTLIEITFIKLCKPDLNTGNEAVLARLHDIEQQLHSGIIAVEAAPKTIVQPLAEENIPQIDVKKMAEAIPEDIKKAIQSFGKIVCSTDSILKALLKKTKPYYLNDNKLTLICEDDVVKRGLQDEKNVSKIKEILASTFQKKYEIHIVSEAEVLSGSNHTKRDVDETIAFLQQKINFEIEEQS